LRKRGVSLLAVGVTQVEGQFQRGELVACLTDQGVEIARGLSNYDSDASKLIAGCSSEKRSKPVLAGEFRFCFDFASKCVFRSAPN